MGENSKIAWTDHTFNPWWGCAKVSAGCASCYAATLAHRLGYSDGGTKKHALWGPGGRRRFFSDEHWQQPRRWNAKAEREGVRQRVFCGSMCDVFETLPGAHPDRDATRFARRKLWALVYNTPRLDWQLLTKRPQNIAIHAPYDVLVRNIWLGTTVENQEAADERIPHLLRIPARVRFLSVEPMTGPVNLKAWTDSRPLPDEQADRFHAPLHWVIVGCESGPRARPMDLDRVRSLRDQCVEAGVPFFFKQAMIADKLVRMPELDGRVWDQVPRP